MKLSKNITLKQAISCHLAGTGFLLKNSSTTQKSFVPALIFFSLLIFSPVPLFFSVISAHAIQPAFIKGTIFNTFNSTLVTGATITTANGVSTASSNGAYVLRVPPGIYTLIANAPDYSANLLSGISATPGNIAQVDFGITPASTPIGYVAGYVIRSSSGEGIQGALITTDLGGATIASGRDGSFRLPSPSGLVTITVSANGFASKQITKYTITPYITTNLTINLDTASSARMAVKGIIKDACTGIRINNAIVLSNAGEISISTDGFYSIDTPLGLSTIVVSADGYQFNSQTFFLSPFSIKTFDFSIIPSASGTGLVHGLITNATTGNPISGARIEADSGETSFSSKDGTYKLYTSICTTTLFVSRKGFAPLSKFVSVSKGTVTSRNFSMQPFAVISGFVRDRHTGSGINGATITLSEDPSVSCISSSDGSYVLKDLEPGTHTINISHPCYLSGTQEDIHVSAEASIEQDILLDAIAIATVQGAVVNIFNGRPIDDVMVSTGHGATAQTDNDGFYILDLPACRTDITMHSPGYLPLIKKNITPAPGEILELNTVLIPWPFHIFTTP